MIKSTLATAATVAAITIGAMGTATTPAQAGVNVHVHGGFWGAPVHVGPGHWHGGHYGNPCRRWKRKYHRTGRFKYLKRYRRCMRRWY